MATELDNCIVCALETVNVAQMRTRRRRMGVRSHKFEPLTEVPFIELKKNYFIGLAESDRRNRIVEE